MDIEEIADWVGKSVLTVYRALAAIEPVGLGKIRVSGQVIFELPWMLASKHDAKEFAINAKDRAEDEKLEADVAIALEAFQGALGRDLTESERKSFVRRFLAKDLFLKS